MLQTLQNSEVCISSVITLLTCTLVLFLSSSVCFNSILHLLCWDCHFLYLQSTLHMLKMIPTACKTGKHHHLRGGES